MRLSLRLLAGLVLGAGILPAARLSQPAERAFESYVTSVEHGMPRQPIVEGDSSILPGEVRVEPLNGGTWAVDGGLLHHWRGAAFVPGVSPQDLLALLRDYGGLAQHYAPEVMSSRVLAGGGRRSSILMRFKKQKVITVVLDAQFDVESGLTSNGRGYSTSRSRHIWQVDQPGSAQEHRRPEGDDDGFLWRLNSYWNFEQRPEGLLMQCEAVSLTRGIPAGLGWLVTPIIETLPRDSLEFTLTATRNALAASGTRSHTNASKH